MTNIRQATENELAALRMLWAELVRVYDDGNEYTSIDAYAFEAMAVRFGLMTDDPEMPQQDWGGMIDLSPLGVAALRAGQRELKGRTKDDG